MATVIQFTVGDVGAPTDGVSNYYSPALANKKIKVFREGVFQYRSGQNFIIVPGPGTIIFFPAFQQGERVRIHAI